MVSAVIVSLVVLTVKTGNFNFNKKGYTVKVRFKNIDGVDKNSPILLQGFEVGAVKDIRIVEENGAKFMELDALVKNDVKLKQGAQAYVKSLGFMGEKYVALTFGDDQAPELTDGAVIQGTEPTDFQELLHSGQGIAQDVKSITQNLDERLTKNKESIDHIFENLDTTMKHVAHLSERLDQRLAANEQTIDDIFANVKSSTKNLDMFTYDLKLNPWKLLYRPREKRELNIQDSK